MDEWIDRLARALGEEAVAPAETGALLKLSREVAHGVERKLAPVSTFLAGLYVGRQVAAGVPRGRALDAAIARAAELLPDSAGD